MTKELVQVWMSSEKKPGARSWYHAPSDITYKLEKQENLPLTSEDSELMTTIHVNPEKQYQSILGVGTSIEESTVYCLGRMSEVKKHEVLTKLVHSEEGIGLNLIRVCIGTPDFTGRKFYTYDDRLNNEVDNNLDYFSIQKDIEYGIINTLKEALEINPDIKFFASPWTPPGWMKEKSNEFTEDNEYNLKGGKLKDEYIETLAKYYCKFIQAYEEQGIPIYSMTLQNEPMLEINYPSCSMTSHQEKELAIALKKELAAQNLKTKIWVFDHNFNDGKKFAIETLDSKEALAAIDGIAFHDYDGEPTTMQEVKELFPDKDVMLTERSVWGTKGADRIAQYFRNSAISYNSWVTMLDSNITPHQWVGTPDPTMLVQDSIPTCILKSGNIYDNYWLCPEYYLLGQFSKFVQPGAKRIDSNYGEVDKVTNVAFLNPDNNIVTIVINQTKETQSFKIQCKGHQVSAKVPGGTVATFVWEYSF
ncbi:MAG: glycosyl hydrolase [Clostridiaceae bacterium]|nr:glycosyl hydrolase [Clostridiaceae bacterium]